MPPINIGYATPLRCLGEAAPILTTLRLYLVKGYPQLSLFCIYSNIALSLWCTWLHSGGDWKINVYICSSRRTTKKNSVCRESSCRNIYHCAIQNKTYLFTRSGSSSQSRDFLSLTRTCIYLFVTAIIS